MWKMLVISRNRDLKAFVPVTVYKQTIQVVFKFSGIIR